MTDMLVFAELASAVHPVNELLNVAHDRPFSLLFANYSWLLGIAGGVALVWAMKGGHQGRRANPIFQLAMPLCVVLIIAGFLNVLAEVRQPSRLLYGYIQGWNYWDTALIKYGIILLPIFLMCSWWLTFQCIDRNALDARIRALPASLLPLADFMTLWSRHYHVFDNRLLTIIVRSVVVVLGLFAPLYSGIFLMYEHGVSVWNSPAQALIFIAISIAKGAAIFMIFAPIMYRAATGQQLTARLELRWVALAGLIFSGVVWEGWIWWIERLGTTSDQQFAALINGPYHSLVFWHWRIIGLLIPLLLLLLPPTRIGRLIAGVAILWGSYVVRLVVLLGGQAINRSGAGYLTFGLESDVVWYTGCNLLLLVGMMSLLLLLPYGTGDGANPGMLMEE